MPKNICTAVLMGIFTVPDTASLVVTSYDKGTALGVAGFVIPPTFARVSFRGL